jgi:hypothetical protein
MTETMTEKAARLGVSIREPSSTERKTLHPLDRTIPEKVRTTGKRYPDREALAAAQRELSYSAERGPAHPQVRADAEAQRKDDARQVERERFVNDEMDENVPDTLGDDEEARLRRVTMQAGLEPFVDLRTPIQRTVLAMRFPGLLDWPTYDPEPVSFPKISETLGYSPSWSKTHYDQARRSLGRDLLYVYAPGAEYHLPALLEERRELQRGRPLRAEPGERGDYGPIRRDLYDEVNHRLPWFLDGSRRDGKMPDGVDDWKQCEPRSFPDKFGEARARKEQAKGDYEVWDKWYGRNAPKEDRGRCGVDEHRAAKGSRGHTVPGPWHRHRHGDAWGPWFRHSRRTAAAEPFDEEGRFASVDPDSGEWAGD